MRAVTFDEINRLRGEYNALLDRLERIAEIADDHADGAPDAHPNAKAWGRVALIARGEL